MTNADILARGGKEEEYATQQLREPLSLPDRWYELAGRVVFRLQ